MSGCARTCQADDGKYEEGHVAGVPTTSETTGGEEQGRNEAGGSRGSTKAIKGNSRLPTQLRPMTSPIRLLR